MLGIVFAGQGSQIASMGSALCQRHREAQAVFEEADEILNGSVSAYCRGAGEEALARTRYAQAAILTVEIALLRTLQARQALPVAFLAGHSVGEYSALVAAGALTFADALRLVDRRAALMDENSSPLQGMLAVGGLSADRVLEAHSRLAAEGLAIDVACHNSPEQVVLAGAIADLEHVEAQLAPLGAKLSRLKVGGAFHSRALEGCAEGLLPALAKVAWQPAAIPVIANASARPYPRYRAAWPALLSRQVRDTVRWNSSMRFMALNGVTHVLEIGPSSVLARGVRVTAPSMQVAAFCDVADLQAAEDFVHPLRAAAIDSALVGRCLAHVAATRAVKQPGADFETQCRAPYRAVLERWAAAREQGVAPTAQTLSDAVALFEGALAAKGVAVAEACERREEIAWFDRHGLVSA